MWILHLQHISVWTSQILSAEEPHMVATILDSTEQNNLLIFLVSKIRVIGTSLVVQWLGVHASTTGGTGSIPGQGTKILHATQWG